MSDSTSEKKTRWMIYGANGYTGKLAARVTRPLGMEAPILAGRNADAIRPLAESLNYEHRIFDLSSPTAIDKALEDVKVIVLAAGPFVNTSPAIVDACIRTKTHYLDITGEYSVFEAIHARNQEARDAGVCLLPGIGLDVVPTDCLAARLKVELPSATHLQMVLIPEGSSISPGTSKTMLQFLQKATQARVNGTIQDDPRPETDIVEWKTPKGETISSTPMSWGDISTAFYSTGIPNIEVFFKVSSATAAARTGWGLAALRYVASWSAGRWMLEKAIERFVTGPSESQRGEGRSHFQGIAWDDKTKEAAEMSLTTAEGYQFTAWSMVTGANKLMTSHRDASGAHTPSTLFGVDYVLEFDHSEWGNAEKKQLTDEELSKRRAL